MFVVRDRAALKESESGDTQALLTVSTHADEFPVSCGPVFVGPLHVGV